MRTCVYLTKTPHENTDSNMVLVNPCDRRVRLTWKMENVIVGKIQKENMLMVIN